MKIGLLLPGSGPAGLWSPSAEACALLAAAEINATGGVLGRPIELVLGDAGTSPAQAAAETRLLVEVEGIEAIIGMHPSNLRAAVTSALDGRMPYIYTPQYEGGETAPNVYAIGETAEELLTAGITWLVEHRRARRFFFVGSDYVWPRVSLERARRVIGDRGGSLVGERFVPLGAPEFDEVLAAIDAACPQVVVLFMLGLDAVRFHRDFASLGYARRYLRLAAATDETVLYAIGEAGSENLLVASAYFSSLGLKANGRFLERYHASFGEAAPPPNAFGESCYEGLHFLAALAQSTGSVAKLARGRAGEVPYTSARGHATLRARSQRMVHLAEAQGLHFHVISTFHGV